MNALARLLILFGILWCLMGGYYLYLRYKPNALQFDQYQTTPNKQEKIETQKTEETTEEKSQPTRIVINDLKINLQIFPATITNDVWETNSKGASYLTSSPLPGEKGNSIIYGHNWVSLFGNLTRAVPGQIVEIMYTDGSTKRFIVEYTSVVAPSESSILAQSNDTRVTLYTCTGFLDAKRFVVVALLKDDKSSLSQATSN